MQTTFKTIGIIGAGNVGSQLARLCVSSGFSVVISNSRGPESLAALIGELGMKAHAATAEQAAQAGDLVIVSTPLHAYGSIPKVPLAGKIVIDTGNYYPARDGKIEEIEDQTATAAQLLQRHLPDSKVVKAFNHIQAPLITADAQVSAQNRRALAIAGDDDSAKRAVTAFIDDLGFDVLDSGSLADSWRIDYPQPAFATYGTTKEMADLVASARR